VHPFVDTVRFQPVGAPGSYVLTVSQLLPYKRVDLAVAACKRLGRELIVVGEGPERARLQALAGPKTSFVGRVSEEELARLYGGCAALLQCGEEDFGMAALEAQACGRPVVAYASGGALETVARDVTGVFFDQPTEECVIEAIRRCEHAGLEPKTIRARAEQFDEAHFRAALLAVVRSNGVHPAITAVEHPLGSA
jgi:glycosyltransferase involved in cell wall biosynthesis